MLFLLLAVACSLTIGVIFKHAGQQGYDKLALLTVNYFAAFMLAGSLLALEGTARGFGPLDVRLVTLGVMTGGLFIAGFFVYALATEVAGMSLAVSVMRLSVVIPFLASWWIWNEVPSLAQGLGLVLAGGAFFMIARRPQPVRAGITEAAPEEEGADGARRVFGVLALLFCAGGLVDVSLKTFDEAFAAAHSRALFLLMVFGVAFLIGLGLVLKRRLRPARATVGWGVVLGLVNYGSAEFILRAIEQLSGPFVFPANNIALVIGAALIGVLVWHEHLSRLNWAGLGLAAVALVLLSL